MPTFVLVAGPPGSGKSSLAAPLATELGLPLLTKDDIKEALMERSLIEVDTTQPVDVGPLAARITALAGHPA